MADDVAGGARVERGVTPTPTWPRTTAPGSSGWSATARDPAFAHKRLSLTPSGKVSYRLRKPYYTGQTEVVLEPVAFLRRLAALVPPRGQHQSGITAPWRLALGTATRRR